MSGEHTPAPWTFLEQEDTESVWNAGEPLTICGPANDDLANVYSSDDSTVANVYSSDDSTVSIPRKQAIANAHLISAAPEMLAALEAQVEHLKGFTDEELRRRDQLGIGGGYDRALIARAVIAKARRQGT